MPTPITRFKCGFCKKHYSIKSDTVRHEKTCLYNPANKSCSTCGYRTDNYCNLKFETIFVQGKPVRDCKDWTEETFDYADW